MKYIISIIFLNSFLFSQSDSQSAHKILSNNLKPFEAYIGKTFKGEFANSTPEKPVYDISHWERALNGNAIRIMHSVNNGEFGGIRRKKLWFHGISQQQAFILMQQCTSKMIS